MSKLKTKKTLLKRLKITKGGKLIRKQTNTGHLKRKWTANKKHRKSDPKKIKSSSYKKNFKKMLGKHA